MGENELVSLYNNIEERLTYIYQQTYTKENYLQYLIVKYNGSIEDIYESEIKELDLIKLKINEWFDVLDKSIALVSTGKISLSEEEAFVLNCIVDWYEDPLSSEYDIILNEKEKNDG